MQTSVLTLENEIVENLLPCGEFILPYCDERFMVSYLNDKDKHSVRIHDLENSLLVGYRDFEGIDEYFVDTPNGEAIFFYGFEGLVDLFENSKLLKDLNNQKKATTRGFYVDTEYRCYKNKLKKYNGVAITLHSISLLIMKEMLIIEGIELEDDYMFVSRMKQSTFLERFYQAVKHYNYDTCKNDVCIPANVKCPIGINYYAPF